MGTPRDDRGIMTLVGVAVAIFGLVYAVGRASMPTFRSTAERILASSTTEAPAPGTESAALIEALNRERLSHGVPAVVDVMGAVEARYAFGRADAPPVWIPLQGEAPEPGDGFPIDVHVRFIAAEATLTLVAEMAEAGVLRTDGMTVVLSADGRSYVADAGDCALELARSGYASVINQWVGEVIVPYFAGQLVCSDVSEIRSGESISFAAVFDYEDH